MSSLRVTSLRGRTTGVSPTLPDGAVVTGVLTATSFSGNGSGLIGVASTDNIITGTAATFNNTANFNSTVNIAGLTTVGVMTVTNALNVTGIVTATSFEGSGANLTGLPEGTNILKAMLYV